MGGVQTNCPAGSCNRLGDIVQESDSFIWFDIAFGMISRGEMKFHVECGSKGLEKVGYEFKSMVGIDMAWNTVFGEDM